MPIIKLPSSISDKEALSIVQGQGLTKVISITHDKNGNKIINAEIGDMKWL